MELGDLDGDGDLDAFVANMGVNKVWLNDGAGTFSDSGQSLGSSESTSTAIALGDLNGDGRMDAFVGNNSEANKVYLQVSCDGDLDIDGDVDGADLGVLCGNLGLVDLGSFAGEFGKDDC